MIPSIHNSKKNLLTELKIHKNKVSSGNFISDSYFILVVNL